MEILLLLLAYILGAIPSGLIIGKLFYNKDIRNYGSGNLGATNTFRTLGNKAGFVVSIMDVLKGSLAVLLPVLFGTDAINPLFLGVIAVIGHMYPIFAGFRGGKAVATSAGVMLAHNPLLILFMAFLFFGTLKLTKYVSLSSIVTVIAAFLYTIIDYLVFKGSLQTIYFVLILGIFIVFRHRSNIKRIQQKIEPKVTWI